MSSLPWFETTLAAAATSLDALEAWLEKFPTERLSQEAAQMLLGYRIDEDAEPEQFAKAIRWLAERCGHSCVPDVCSINCPSVMSLAGARRIGSPPASNPSDPIPRPLSSKVPRGS